jgi:inhibitor of cysteine peptidase
MIALILAMMIAGKTTDVVVDSQSNGRVIRAAKGATVVVRLEAQLGTGYGWQIRQQAKNLQPIGEAEMEHGGGGGITGGTDVQIFRFRVKSRAKGVLSMGYMQPWEKDKPPAKTFSVTIDSR